MKEKLRNKKVVYTIIGIVSVLLVALAVTYAYWLVTKTQTGENEITSGCLDITISGEKNDIELTNQFPMSDEDGMKLVPYEFTVTNNCNTSVDYQVALEATGDSSNALKGTSLKVALNDSYKLYSAYPEVETTIDGAYESRVLGYSKLAAAGSEGSSDTYELRIWIDADAPISEMNKTFTSRISVTIGQGIESGFEEGTLAYDILVNYGGANAVNEIDATEIAERITTTGDKSITIYNKYYYGTDYSYDDTAKKYTLSGTLTQATVTECRNGTKICGKYTLIQTTSAATNATLYEVIDFQSSGNYVTMNTIEYTNTFAKVTTADEAGLYKTQDDLGDSYYFRGAPSNNYVQFGTYAEDTTATKQLYNQNTGQMDTTTVSIVAGTPMYWRIIRINGDGTIRLIFDGIDKVVNGASHIANIGYSVYNSSDGEAKYVGYTYDDGTGTQVDSTIKRVVDAWYDKNLENNYGSYIADSIFCNDRTSRIDDIGYVYYGAYDRLGTNKTPSLKCTNKSDRYTVNDTTIGNGLLTNPIGLITADEEVLAGTVVSKKNTNYYLYNGDNYWTSTPYSWGHFGNLASVWFSSIGELYYFYVTSANAVRPVINLKADVKFTGDGTIDNPYQIVTE